MIRVDSDTVLAFHNGEVLPLRLPLSTTALIADMRAAAAAEACARFSAALVEASVRSPK